MKNRRISGADRRPSAFGQRASLLGRSRVAAVVQAAAGRPMADLRLGGAGEGRSGGRSGLGVGLMQGVEVGLGSRIVELETDQAQFFENRGEQLLGGG